MVIGNFSDVHPGCVYRVCIAFILFLNQVIRGGGPRRFLQRSQEQGRSHGSEDCGALHAPDQHQHRRPPAPESRPRNGGELPAKHAPLIFSMLVPPTRHCYCHFGNLTYHHRVLPSICQQTAGCSATPSDNRLLRWQHVRVRAEDEVTEGSAVFGVEIEKVALQGVIQFDDVLVQHAP